MLDWYEWIIIIKFILKPFAAAPAVLVRQVSQTRVSVVCGTEGVLTASMGSAVRQLFCCRLQYSVVSDNESSNETSAKMTQ
jgi:hypothetical protein